MRTTTDTRFTTPYHLGGFSVEKKTELKQELLHLIEAADAALHQDYLKLEQDMESMQDQNEELSRRVWQLGAQLMEVGND